MSLKAISESINTQAMNECNEVISELNKIINDFLKEKIGKADHNHVQEIKDMLKLSSVNPRSNVVALVEKAIANKLVATASASKPKANTKKKE